MRKNDKVVTIYPSYLVHIHYLCSPRTDILTSHTYAYIYATPIRLNTHIDISAPTRIYIILLTMCTKEQKSFLYLTKISEYLFTYVISFLLLVIHLRLLISLSIFSHHNITLVPIVFYLSIYLSIYLSMCCGSLTHLTIMNSSHRY